MTSRLKYRKEYIMEKRKWIYFAEIERFGYTLQCIGLSEEEVRETMIKEYIETYMSRNGVDPRDEDEVDRYGNHYYSTFLEELYVEKRELNKVIWN